MFLPTLRLERNPFLQFPQHFLEHGLRMFYKQLPSAFSGAALPLLGLQEAAWYKELGISSPKDSDLTLSFLCCLT